jgi:hypothetical protein
VPIQDISGGPSGLRRRRERRVGAITNNGTASLIRSGTLEVPLADKARIRVELGQSTLPILPEGVKASSVIPTDTAHIERLSISIAGSSRVHQ